MQPVRQTAQALVEVVLILPVILALVFGTMAVSRVVQAQNAGPLAKPINCPANARSASVAALGGRPASQEAALRTWAG